MTGHRPYDPRVSERMEDQRDPEAGFDPWRDEPRRSDSPANAATDPWGDSPAWSDGSASPPPVPEGLAEPEAASAPGASADASATCPWCATRAAPGATKCSSCGAALAQRDSIGDLVIPGLTAVDPALKDFADRPLHLSGPSPTHGVASGVIAAAAMGGPMGIAILGGVAAVGAAEYIGATRVGADGMPIDQVGQASGAVLEAVEKLERGEDLPTADSTTPWPDAAADATRTTDAPGPEPATEEETADGGD
jgi:hypothetical protein